MLSSEELLAGSGIDYEVQIPPAILTPQAQTGADTNNLTVRIKPLTVQDLQLISRAAKENDSLMAALMVQRALVEPSMTLAEVNTMHVGLLQFLLQKVNDISGISATAEQLDQAAEAPLAKAAFVLAKEFGWTPEQVGDLTLGQVLLNLQMLKQREEADVRV